MSVPKKIFKSTPSAWTRGNKSVSLELATLTPVSSSFDRPNPLYDINTKVDLYPFPQRKWPHQSPEIQRNRENRRNHYQLQRKPHQQAASITWILTSYILVFFYIGFNPVGNYNKIKKLWATQKAIPLTRTYSQIQPIPITTKQPITALALAPNMTTQEISKKIISKQTEKLTFRAPHRIMTYPNYPRSKILAKPKQNHHTQHYANARVQQRKVTNLKVAQNIPKNVVSLKKISIQKQQQSKKLLETAGDFFLNSIE